MVGVGASKQLGHGYAGAIRQANLHVGWRERGCAQVLHGQAVGGRKPQDVAAAARQGLRLNVLRADGLPPGVRVQHNAHALPAGVFDQIIAIAQRKVVGVHARAAAEHVFTGIAPELVITAATAQKVVTATAMELVVARVAQKRIGPFAAPQHVVTVAAAE